MTEIITDAELVNQYAKKVMEEPEEKIVTRAPSDNTVTLHGGYIAADGSIVKTAEVRELNGEDEEIVAKTGTAAKALSMLLERGLVKIGSEPVTKAHFDTLLSGDRDSILIGIRCATFGKELVLNSRCYSCNHLQEMTVDLIDDVPVRELNNPLTDRQWNVETKLGVVTVALPNGVVQKKLMDNIDKTSAEVNTLLLSGCIVSINGSPSFGAATALTLSMSDRAKIVDEIVRRNPGPRLGEVKKACQACGEEILLPLSLTDLFRL